MRPLFSRPEVKRVYCQICGTELTFSGGFCMVTAMFIVLVIGIAILSGGPNLP